MSNNRLEKAAEFQTRGGLGATLQALDALRRLRPLCSRCRRSEATKVIGLTGDGAPTAVCGDCATTVLLDRRVERQRAERANMRGRR